MVTLTRSRGGIGAAALIGLCLSSLAAMAQEKPVMTSKQDPDTVKVTVTGDVVLDYVWRSREMTEFVNPTTGGGGGVPNGHAINDFEGFAAVRLNADLSDKVSAMIELGTKQVNDGVILPWGQRSANTIFLREGQINLQDFLLSDLRAQIGITTWSFDMRGQGSSMAFDLRHSQSITQNINGTSNGVGGAGGIPVGGRDFVVAGVGDALRTRASVKDELQPVGLVLTYNRDALRLDVVILPAIIEGGYTGADEALYAVDFMYNLDSVGKGSHVGAIIAAHQFNSPAGPGGELMWTIGGGADLWLMDKALEFYAEIYGQFGTVSKPAVGGHVSADGLAFQIGLDYHLPNNGNNLWGGINYTYYSGDNSAVPDSKNGRFAAYENIHDLMIIEDMYMGLDWDSNYWALKLAGGFAMSLGSGKNNLEFSAILGITKTQAEVGFAGGGIGAATTSKNLGDEVDLKARWLLNKQASLNFAVGFLFSSDILKDSMLVDGASKAKSSAMMYTLGADLKF
jgi:hypothetical protein